MHLKILERDIVGPLRVYKGKSKVYVYDNIKTFHTSHTSRLRKTCFVLGPQTTMITNVRNWQKQIYQHLVKIPL